MNNLWKTAVLTIIITAGCAHGPTSTDFRDYLDYSCEELEELGQERAKRWKGDPSKIAKDKVLRAMNEAAEIKNC